MNMLKTTILRFFILLQGCFLLQTTEAQEYPQNYLPPLNIPFNLSGSFAELRNNHFHGGIDLRTEQKEGLPVFAIADGYVSRICISPWGYGKILYIRHPDGFTSVYAHLKEMNGMIKHYLKKEQYSQKAFEVDLYPKENLLKVKKGDTIAFSGNTGSSGGPHLHFEIRESFSNWPINPLLCNYSIEDNIPPRIRRILFYPKEGESSIRVTYYGKKTPYHREYHKAFSLNVQYKNGQYALSGVKGLACNGKFAFAVECHDNMNNSGFKLGIYSIELIVNDTLFYQQIMDKFSFDNTRYLNAHIDYEQNRTANRKYHKLFRQPNNPLNFYKKIHDDAYLHVAPGENLHCKLLIGDYNGNTSKLDFEMAHAPIISPSVKEDTNYIKIMHYETANYFSNNEIELAFQPLSFYDSLLFRYSMKKKNGKIYSNIHKVHNPAVPVHYPYMIRIKAIDLPKHLEEKALICSYGSNASLWPIGGTFNNGYVEENLKYFGSFVIGVDSIAPAIQPINIYNNCNLSKHASIRVRISDNFSGIGTYSACIDGKWILMEYEPKKNLLEYYFDEHLEKGEHVFELHVKDKKNNERSIKINFIR
jgi:murein DD-endopeptidase MepM/ murein hydrolase activator NlpD